MPAEVLSLSLDFFGSTRRTYLCPGIGLVGAGDTYGQFTTAAHPTWTPWLTPTYLVHLGWWGRLSGPADSLTNSSGICQISFESLGMTGGRSRRSSIQGKGSKPSSGTLPPGWTWYQGWIASPCGGLTQTEQCTSWPCYSPSRLAPMLQIDVYSNLVGSSPRRASFWCRIFQWTLLWYGTPSMPSHGGIIEYTYKEAPPIAYRRCHARGQ